MQKNDGLLPMKKTLKVGLIGYGMIGKVHAFGYAALPFYDAPFSFRPQITRVVTSRLETAQAAREALGCAFASTDYRDVTEDPEIDVVDIAAPNDLHRAVLLSAIRAGKHIYCDKPLCVTLAEAQEIESALQTIDAQGNPLSKKTSQMTFHMRFYPAIRRAKQLLDEGRLGRIFQYRIAYLHASNARADAPFKWKQGASGGVILDLAAHLFDLIDALIGLPDELLAQTQTAFSTRRDANNADQAHTELSEDAVSILTRTASAQGEFTGVIEATKLATGEEDQMRLELHGEKGAIRFSLMEPHYLEFFDATRKDRPYGGTSGWTRIAVGNRRERPETDFPSTKATSGWIQGHVACLSHFLRSIEAGEPGNPNLLQGVRIQKALDAAARSAKNRTWVSLKW